MSFPRRTDANDSDFDEALSFLQPWTSQAFLVEIYENQSREGLRWGIKYLGDHHLKPFSSKDGSVNSNSFPKRVKPPVGYEWTDTWRPRVDRFSDDQGWTYAANFSSFMAQTNVSALASPQQNVRRRQWVRPMQRIRIDYKWKTQELGMSLSSLEERQELVNYIWGDGPLGITLFATGKSQLPVVKQKANHANHGSSVKVGDTLVALNGKSLSGLQFGEVVSLLQTCERPATLTFEKPRIYVLCSAVHSSDIRRCGIKPGHVLCGINGRSLRNIQYNEVVNILQSAPGPCILHFESPVSNDKVICALGKSKDGQIKSADDTFYRRAQNVSVCTTVAAIGAILIA